MEWGESHEGCLAGFNVILVSLANTTKLSLLNHKPVNNLPVLSILVIGS